jgi:hypothetical protein
VEGLRKEYNTRSAGKFMAADGIDLQIDKGGMTALLGPSGSGGHACAGQQWPVCLLDLSNLCICFFFCVLTYFVCACRAGKTTLLRLIAGLEEPTAGRIFFDGAPAQPPMHVCAFKLVYVLCCSLRALGSCHVAPASYHAMWAYKCGTICPVLARH